MPATKEQRRFIRMPFRREATVEGPTGTVAAWLDDISLNGVRLTLEDGPPGPEHALYRLTVALAPGATVRMELRLVHLAGCKAGFQCRRMDSESLSNLKRLVALYYGPGAGMDAELDRLQAMIRQRSAETGPSVPTSAAS